MAGPAAGATRRRLLAGLAVIAVVLAVAALASGGRARRSGPPLSPRSDVADGTSALVSLLGELGSTTEVVAGAPPREAATALLLRDELTAVQRGDVEQWVLAGGTLVVADGSSPLGAATERQMGAGAAIERGECSTPGLDGIARIATDKAVQGLSLGSPRRLRLPPEGGTSCFDRYVVTVAAGRGTIISIGGPEPFVNGLIGLDDGAALAADLLAPNGSERVAVIDVVPAPGAGSASLLDLVAPRVKVAFAAAFVAFVVYALHRGRRLGRPIVEPQPVAIPGSGLVSAVGHMQQRSGAAERAAAALRADARRAIGRRLGVPIGAPTSAVAQVAAARTGLDPARVAAALSDDPVADEALLVALTHELDAIRQEVLNAPR